MFEPELRVRIHLNNGKFAMLSFAPNVVAGDRRILGRQISECDMVSVVQTIDTANSVVNEWQHGRQTIENGELVK